MSKAVPTESLTELVHAKEIAHASIGKSTNQPMAKGTAMRLKRCDAKVAKPRLASSIAPKNPAIAKKTGIRKTWIETTSRPASGVVLGSW